MTEVGTIEVLKTIGKGSESKNLIIYFFILDGKS